MKILWIRQYLTQEMSRYVVKNQLLTFFPTLQLHHDFNRREVC